MSISVSVDSKMLLKFAERFPNATAKALGDFTERVGAKVERQAKAGAPVVHGNLRRQIRFIQSSPIAGVIKSFANYSKFVHGAPFYTFDSLTTKKGRARKITPFLTNALSSSETFIESERGKIFKNIISSL